MAEFSYHPILKTADNFQMFKFERFKFIVFLLNNQLF